MLVICQNFLIVLEEFLQESSENFGARILTFCHFSLLGKSYFYFHNNRPKINVLTNFGINR
jgi:N-formylglutamate amidohydrolase